MRNNKDAVNKFRFLLEKNKDIHISSIILHELIEGANLSNDAQGNLEKINALAKVLNILSFDKNSAYISGKISAKKEVRENPIGQNDIFIAAVAINYKLRLVTRNKKHFDSIENIEIEEW